MADRDAWKREHADEMWRKGKADAERRGWADVKPRELSAAEVEAARKKKEEAARKKKEQGRTALPTSNANLSVLADMRRSLGR